MVKVVLKPLLMHGVGISFLIGYFLSKRLTQVQVKRIGEKLNLAYCAYFVMASLVVLHYLFWPSYIDHIEATVSLLSIKLKEGVVLYPSFDSYTLHGLLYGPLLAEILMIFQWLPFDVIMNSKLPGALAFFVVGIWFLRGINRRVTSGYFLILLTFWDFLYWNRADSIFLLITVAAWAVVANGERRKIFMLGVLGGLASALKLHGVLYVIPFFCLFQIRHKAFMPQVFLDGLWFLLGCAAALFLSFLVPEVSISDYMEYLRAASGHKILIELVVTNLAFSFVFLMPAIIVVLKSEVAISCPNKIWLSLIILCVAIASVIGGKIGSGIHHLLPFVIFAAAYIDTERELKLTVQKWLITSFLILAAYLVVGPVPKKILREIDLHKQSWIFNKAKDELLAYKEKYPAILMGVGGGGDGDFSYSLTYYRVLLESRTNQQIDSSAFMDMAYAGVTDDSLNNHLASCVWGGVLIPKGSSPFSVINPYNQEYLFSERVRNTFREKYEIVDSGEFYDVYKCVDVR